LEHYVERSWLFVTLRIDSPPIGSLPHWEGDVEPIHLSFSTPDPVYPLRISAISADQQSDVVLWVYAAHRMTAPGASTEYANRISGDDAEYLQAEYPRLSEILAKPGFLTMLTRTYAKGEMVEDIHLAPAERDVEYRQIYYSGIPVVEGLLALTIGWGALHLRRPRRTFLGR